MGHEVVASLPVESANGAIDSLAADHGVIPEVDLEKMPLLSPHQLGPFKLSHRHQLFRNLIQAYKHIEFGVGFGRGHWRVKVLLGFTFF